MQYKLQQENSLHLQDELLQQIHDSIIVTDLDGKILFWNRRASLIFGYTAEEITGQTIAILYPENEKVHLAQHLRSIMNGKELRGEVQGLRKDGTSVWLDMKTSYLQTFDVHEQKIECILYIGEEITAYKQAEKEKLNSFSLSQAILDSVNVIMAVLDVDGKILFVNEAWRRLGEEAGVPKSQAQTGVGMNYLEVCRNVQGECAEQAQAVLSGIEAVLQGKQSSFTTEYVCFLSTEKRWYMMSVTSLEGSSGAVVTHVDITERKHLEQQKTIFTSMASHELRSPLAVLKGLAQLAKKQWQRQGLHEPIHFLVKMETQINHLIKLVDELLDVAKIEAGRLDYAQEMIDLDALAYEVIETAQETTHGFKMSIQGQSGATISGDHDKLAQVFTNLLSNAVKYSAQSAQKEINVYLDASADTAFVRVQDHGIGIARENQQRIFEPFQRVDASNHSPVPGMGMGLYITHEIMKQHGGEITVASEDGKGSTFTVSLPLSSRASAMLPEQGNSHARHGRL